MNFEKKIVFVLASYSGGGAEKMLINLANGFAEQNHDTSLLVFQPVGPYKKLVSEKIRIKEAPFSLKAFFLIPWLISQFLLLMPDRIISTQNASNVVTVLSALPIGFRKKVILREASVPSAKMRGKKGITEKVYDVLSKFLYPMIDKHVAISNYVKKDLIRYYELDPENIRTIYNPVITDEVDDLILKNPSEDWFQNSEPVAIAVGGIRPEKNYPVLVELIRVINDRRNCKLIILGDFTDLEEYRKLRKSIRELNLTDKIKFKGFKENPYSYLAKADVFIHSSKYEGGANSIVEALYCGCPVVATQCPGAVKDILDDDKCGELIPYGDVYKMTEATIRQMEKSNKFTSFKKRKDIFTTKKSVKEYMAYIYD